MSNESSNPGGLRVEERQCLTCEWLQLDNHNQFKGGDAKDRSGSEKAHWADWCELFPNAPLGKCGGYTGRENNR